MLQVQVRLCKAGIRWHIPTPTQCCAPSTSLLLWPLSRQPPRGEQTFRVALEDVEVNRCWTCRCVVHLLIKDTASSAERLSGHVVQCNCLSKTPPVQQSVLSGHA